MVFNATFNNISVISWRSVLLVEETYNNINNTYIYKFIGVRHGCDRMVVGQRISPITLGVRIQPRRDILDTTLWDKVCQWLTTCRWFSQGPPVSSTNKTDRHDITEILLKVALNFRGRLWTQKFWLVRRVTNQNYRILLCKKHFQVNRSQSMFVISM
jgi:hypothetical protein